MKQHDYDCGWFLKAPYTANNLFYRGHSFPDFKSVLEEINSAFKRGVGDVFPYLLLQPTIPNRREYKVIIHDGECKYFHQRGANSYYSPRLNSPVALQVMGFAKLVYDTLASKTDCCILSGLMRIDVMRITHRNINKLVVNEIEGIDSNYSV
jgi:hypothetical protein